MRLTSIRAKRQANERVFEQLENHELDAIVQARMLGEGFDHPYLAVAMVGSIFANLSPFVQFVGRIMRSIEQNAAGASRSIRAWLCFTSARMSRGGGTTSDSSAKPIKATSPSCCPRSKKWNSPVTPLSASRAGAGSQPVEILEERGVRAADMEPIGDPQAAALLGSSPTWA